MIIATVRTCTQRWSSYRALRGSYDLLGLSMPLRTFQTREASDNPCVNSRLTARAALAYADRNLADSPDSWALFLEDDVMLREELKGLLGWLVDYGTRHVVDCWYLCNRKTPVARQFSVGEVTINELSWPIIGSHALLIPKRHLKRMLGSHWLNPCDSEMFAAIRHKSMRVLQVIHPILAEHNGEFSTFNPQRRSNLKVNYANSSNPD